VARGPGIWYYGGIDTSYWDTGILYSVLRSIVVLRIVVVIHAFFSNALCSHCSRLRNRSRPHWQSDKHCRAYEVLGISIHAPCPVSSKPPLSKARSEQDFFCVAKIKITITPRTQRHRLSATAGRMATSYEYGVVAGLGLQSPCRCAVKMVGKRLGFTPPPPQKEAMILLNRATQSSDYEVLTTTGC
jgi:hypothetical protein